jgi:hypothetical protein
MERGKESELYLTTRLTALAHERLSPRAGKTLGDQEMSEIVQGTRIDLSVWLK